MSVTCYSRKTVMMCMFYQYHVWRYVSLVKLTEFILSNYTHISFAYLVSAPDSLSVIVLVVRLVAYIVNIKYTRMF